MTTKEMQVEADPEIPASLISCTIHVNWQKNYWCKKANLITLVYVYDTSLRCITDLFREILLKGDIHLEIYYELS